MQISFLFSGLKKDEARAQQTLKCSHISPIRFLGICIDYVDYYFHFGDFKV